MCILCTSTDELHAHQPLVERLPSGRGQGGDVGPYASPGVPPHAAEHAALWDELRAACARIEALEIMVLDLRSRERLSREP